MKKTKLNRGCSKLVSCKKLKRKPLKLNRKKINFKSKKQESIEASYKDVKKKNFNEETLCSGCEKTLQSTPSHLIPRSWNRSLVDNELNIKPHCIKCHQVWESKDRVFLLDYKENLKIVKKLDISYYQILKRNE